MKPLVFIGEAKLAKISKGSAVRVVIEISLPPPKDEQKELNEARMILAKTYSSIAEGMANYLGAVQYELIQDPLTGLESATIIIEHLKKAAQEAIIPIHKFSSEDSKPEERETWKSYQ